MSAEPAVDRVGAVVLAGGRSRRFGAVKADADWRGRDLLEHVLRALPSERVHTLLVTRPGQAPLGAAAGFDAVVEDDPADAACPLRGVIRGLRACPARWAWVVACDLPLLRPDLLRLLLQQAAPGDLAVVPQWRGRIQPLCALYATAAADGLASSLATGERSIHGALAAIGFRTIPETDLCGVDPRGTSFVNVNTPQDLTDLESAACDRPETEKP
jgi:molybdenum cofactor guanylyltransferase